MNRHTPAAEQLDVPISVYRILRSVAGRKLFKERRNHTLRPTELVHEAFLRLRHLGTTDIRDETHLIRLVTRAMRRVLIEHARRRSARKRAHRITQVPLEHVVDRQGPGNIDLLVLDEMLDRLMEIHERQAIVLELRIFAGLSVEETARALGVSERTAKSDWQVALAWLRRELTAEA